MSADEIRDQLDSLNGKVDDLDGKVESVDRKQDAQLRILRGSDTNPNEGLIARVGELEKEQAKAAKFRQRMIGVAMSAMALAGGYLFLWAAKALWATAVTGK